jgi:hypothetical protein
MGAEPTARHPPRSQRALAAPLPVVHRTPTLYIVYTVSTFSRARFLIAVADAVSEVPLAGLCCSWSVEPVLLQRWDLTGTFDGSVAATPTTTLTFFVGREVASFRCCSRSAQLVRNCAEVEGTTGSNYSKRPSLQVNAATLRQTLYCNERYITNPRVGQPRSLQLTAAQLFARHGNHRRERYCKRRPKLCNRQPDLLP